MIWLAWRQFRAQAITAAVIVGVLAIGLAATGPHLAGLYNSAGLNACHADCGAIASNFIASIKAGAYGQIFYVGIAVLYAGPALIGIFWGAPLVSREFETGTFRLTWNQSVPRSRWMVMKLALVGLASVAAAGLVSLMITWWASPVDSALALSGGESKFSRIDPLVFAARGIVPLGYAAFAFVLGVTVGVLIRRTLPAMAITLVLFAAVQLVMPIAVRPHLISPATATAPLDLAQAAIDIQSTPDHQAGIITVQGSLSLPGAWVLSSGAITPAGKTFSVSPPQACLGSNMQACNDWLASLHLREQAVYQPASRFWPLQWIELAIYLVLTAGLGAVCAWQVRRKRL